MKEKAMELAELRKKLEDADADIVAKDANIVEKVAEIENLKRLIKVLLLLRRNGFFSCCNFSLKEANETIEARNDELDAKTEELKSVMKKLIETNAELSKVISMMMTVMITMTMMTMRKVVKE